MIKADEGHIVFPAYLKNNSLSVSKGQRVKAGEKIPLVGNSGNSAVPDLHINLLDQADDLLTANVIPSVFSEYRSPGTDGRWLGHRDSVPEVGDIIDFS